MGGDAGGNRYYENRVDYPCGQHRWVEPGDIHNFDSSSIPPEWQGWMTSMNDIPPSQEEKFFEETAKEIDPMCRSNAPDKTNVGYQNKNLFHFHHMHDQSQVRSRGFNIGNPVVGLPPNAPNGYYTQPGSPYNPASIKKLEFIGDLDQDKGGGRPYKSDKWADRLTTDAEKEAVKKSLQKEMKRLTEKSKVEASRKKKLQMLRSRGGGTIMGASS